MCIFSILENKVWGELVEGSLVKSSIKTKKRPTEIECHFFLCPLSYLCAISTYRSHLLKRRELPKDYETHQEWQKRKTGRTVWWYNGVNHPLLDFFLLDKISMFLCKLAKLEFSVLLIKDILSKRGIYSGSFLKISVWSKFSEYLQVKICFYFIRKT